MCKGGLIFLLVSCLRISDTALGSEFPRPENRAPRSHQGPGFDLVEMACPSVGLGGSRRDRIVAVTEGVWTRAGSVFGGAASGTTDPQTIAGFWGAVPQEGDAWTTSLARRWKSEPAGAAAQHWSAAFTSWVMCEAGLGLNEFRRSAAHWRYLSYARTNAEAAHAVEGVTIGIPDPGDLVCAEATGRFLEVVNTPRDRPLLLHCHVVTAVDIDHVTIVGGNVAGAIAKNVVPIVSVGGVPAMSRGHENKGGSWAWLAIMRLKQ